MDSPFSDAIPLSDLAEARAASILRIDLGALAANYARLAAEPGPGVCCAAAVKGDAYGLGLETVAPVLARAGCRHFFVARLDEAVALRRILPRVRIYLLDGLLPGSEDELYAHRLVPVLGQIAEIEAWARQARRMETRLPAAIQVDTGMARLGLGPEEIDRLAADGMPGALALRLVMSHLAAADAPAAESNDAQRRRFEAARARLPRAPASLANSSGLFLGPAYHFDMVRPGAAIYGVNPTPGRANPMQPVVTLQARLLQIRDLPAGTPVGYHGDFVTARPSRIGTVATGYADGYPRAAAGRARAIVAGREVPVVARISMDMLALDLTDLEPGDLEPGEPAFAGRTPLARGQLVDLLGPAYTVDDLATAAGTIGYEILTGLGRRHHRSYRHAESLPAELESPA